MSNSKGLLTARQICENLGCTVGSWHMWLRKYKKHAPKTHYLPNWVMAWKAEDVALFSCWLRDKRKVGRAPFGYRYVNGEQVEDPEQMRIVRSIVRNYKKGVGFTEIARRLNKRKVRSEAGKAWTPQMVQRIVRTNG